MNDVEYKFEQWRFAALTGRQCSNALKEFIWKTADESIGALMAKRCHQLMDGMRQHEKDALRTELIIMFLEFTKANSTKAIGWCFKTFKMRFPDVLARIEAKKYGLGIKSASGIQCHETQTIRREFKAARLKESAHPVIPHIMKDSLIFDEDCIELTDTGAKIDFDLYKVNRINERKKTKRRTLCQ